MSAGGRWAPGLLRGVRKDNSANVDAEGGTEPPWVDLCCAPAELRPDMVLPPGQSFGWKRLAVDRWIGVIQASAVVIRQTSTTTFAQVLAGPASPEDVRAYFGLCIADAPPLAELYKKWSAACPRLAKVAARLPGLRVLQQDPLETLFTFICSSNNNVSRIALLSDRLCAEYGHKICALPSSCVAADDAAFSSSSSNSRQLTHIQEFNARRCLHAFPTIAALEKASEASLRRLGLGYRAAYIRGAAKALLKEGGEAFLLGLQRSRGTSLNEARTALCRLPGIGPKVADCVAFFALGHHDCIPVDVHVWRITTRDYDPTLRKAKSLTPAVYEQVGQAWRSRFGEYAGWAHSLLFGAEVAGSEAQARLPPELLQDMADFREEERTAAVQRKMEVKRRPSASAGIGASISSRASTRKRQVPESARRQPAAKCQPATGVKKLKRTASKQLIPTRSK